jgi:hypothetical protein
MVWRLVIWVICTDISKKSHCIHLLLIVKMKATSSSVMLVSVYRRHIPEDRNLNAYRYDNFQCPITYFIFVLLWKTFSWSVQYWHLGRLYIYFIYSYFLNTEMYRTLRTVKVLSYPKQEVFPCKFKYVSKTSAYTALLILLIVLIIIKNIMLIQCLDQEVYKDPS